MTHDGATRKQTKIRSVKVVSKVVVFDFANNLVGIKNINDKKVRKDWLVSMNNPIVAPYFKCKKCGNHLDYNLIAISIVNTFRTKCFNCMNKSN